MAETLDAEKTEPSNIISGNRIVNINFLLSWAMTLQVEHSKRCTSGTLILESEKRVGLTSKFIFVCNTCEAKIVKCSEDPNKKSVVNYGAVWGTLTNGSTYTHLSDLLTRMDVPPMAGKTFQKIETELSQVNEHEM